MYLLAPRTYVRSERSNEAREVGDKIIDVFTRRQKAVGLAVHKSNFWMTVYNEVKLTISSIIKTYPSSKTMVFDIPKTKYEQLVY